MIFLGTGASEAIPCIFCSCEYCETARHLQGKNIRTRSSLLIDQHNLIDFSPDIFKQCLDNHINLCDLKNIFFTHTHDDHLDLSELITLTSATPWPKEKINLYLSPQAAACLQDQIDFYVTHYGAYTQRYFDLYTICSLEPFQTYTIDTLQVTPLLSSHSSYGPNELGFNYLIQTPTCTFLYACDTGWYPDCTWLFLKNKAIDSIMIECTYGVNDTLLQPFAPEHLDFKNMVAMLDKLTAIQAITPTTSIYVTHLSHIMPLTHETFQNKLDSLSYNIYLAYDGLSIS